MSNNNIIEIRTLIEEIETRIVKIKELFEDSEPSMGTSEIQATRMKILAEVHKKGGIVTKNEWKKIGKKYGIDARGLGGFFVGDGSMVRIGDDKRALTEKGVRIAKIWLEKQEE